MRRSPHRPRWSAATGGSGPCGVPLDTSAPASIPTCSLAQAHQAFDPAGRIPRPCSRSASTAPSRCFLDLVEADKHTARSRSCGWNTWASIPTPRWIGWSTRPPRGSRERAAPAGGLRPAGTVGGLCRGPAPQAGTTTMVLSRHRPSDVARSSPRGLQLAFPAHVTFGRRRPSHAGTDTHLFRQATRWTTASSGRSTASSRPTDLTPVNARRCSVTVQ